MGICHGDPAKVDHAIEMPRVADVRRVRAQQLRVNVPRPASLCMLYKDAGAAVSNSYAGLSTLGRTPLPANETKLMLSEAFGAASAASATIDAGECPDVWSRTSRAPDALPQRPDRSALSESIPLFYIGRNRNGFWVVRSADGRIGGLFVFKRSAVRFAREESEPAACALMFVAEPLELT